MPSSDIAGVDPPGAQRVDGDPARRQLEGEGAREADDAVLRRAVRGVARHAEAPEHGRHVDHASAGAHQRQRFPRHEIGAVRFVSMMRRHAASSDPSIGWPPPTPGVVHQHVERAPALAQGAQDAQATDAATVTSIGSASASPPRSRISAAVRAISAARARRNRHRRSRAPRAPARSRARCRGRRRLQESAC